MDIGAVVAAVQDGIESIAPPPPPPAEWPLWVRHAASVLVPGQGLEPLVEALRGQADLAIFDSRMQQLGHQARQVTLLDLAHWLVSRGRSVGSEQAVNDLYRYVTEPSYPVEETWLLSGITLADRREVANGIHIVPFAQLTPSVYKEMFAGDAHGILALTRSTPTVALTCPNAYPRHHFARDSQQLINPSGRSAELSGLRLILTLIGPSASVLLAAWSAPAESVPLASSVLAWSHSPGEGDVNAQTALTPMDLNRVNELYLLFSALPESARQRFRIPLERLNRALRRIDLTNAFIELGIALEALLLNDLDDDRGELTFRLRTRGARLLGETFEERIRIGRTLRDVYTLRSISVHTGAIPKDAVSTSITEVLQSGCRLTAHAIERMLRAGSPDWERVTLS